MLPLARSEQKNSAINRPGQTPDREKTNMSIKRRSVLKGMLATGVSMAALKAPAVHGQGAPFELGLLTVKTGPLAQGGIQMEQGVLNFLTEKNNTMAGRKVELFSADTG